MVPVIKRKVTEMVAQIHQITWNGQTYFKVYAENLNGRMQLVSKKKYATLKEAKAVVKIMLPSYTLDRKIKEINLG